MEWINPNMSLIRFGNFINQALSSNHAPIVGIYELNPVYDTLSMISMRTLGTFLFECFRLKIKKKPIRKMGFFLRDIRRS